MKSFKTGQSTSAGFENKGTSKCIRLAGGTLHGNIEHDSIHGLVVLSEAADNGVPVIDGRTRNTVEHEGGIREAAGRGGGAEVKKLGTGEVVIEKAGGYEVGLKLLDVRKGSALPQKLLHIGGHAT